MSCVEFLFSVLLQTVIKTLNFYDMIAVVIITLAMLGALVIFMLVKMRELDAQIDDIYNKIFVIQGDIEENRAHLNAHYADMAQLNADIEKVANRVSEFHKHEHADESVKEVDAELENFVPEIECQLRDKALQLLERRECFAHLRSHGVSLHEAADKMHISYSTAKRYEQWRQSNKK